MRVFGDLSLVLGHLSFVDGRQSLRAISRKALPIRDERQTTVDRGFGEVANKGQMTKD